MSKLYSAKSVALLTQHGKEKWIAPILEPALGCQIIHTTAYDTDLLGTFSGEIKRLDSQINTARAKAKMGMALTSSAIGIASEGAFIPDPFSGLMPWNIEVVIWIDDANQWEVIGIAQGAARNLSKTLTTVSDLESFAHEAGFPEHHLLLKSETQEGIKIEKGISDWETLRTAFHHLHSASKNQRVDAESDLRAFCNPTRQGMIERATMDLLNKLQSLCPSCAAPGYWITQHKAGLPCRACGQPTKLALWHQWTCNACRFAEHRPSGAIAAEPSQCDACNP